MIKIQNIHFDLATNSISYTVTVLTQSEAAERVLVVARASYLPQDITRITYGTFSVPEWHLPSFCQSRAAGAQQESDDKKEKKDKKVKNYTVRESNPCRIENHLMATMHDTVSPTV